MEHDMSFQRVIIACVEAIKQIAPAELPFIGIADPVPAKRAAAAAVDVGKYGRKAKGLAAAAMCYESGHEK